MNPLTELQLYLRGFNEGFTKAFSILQTAANTEAALAARAEAAQAAPQQAAQRDAPPKDPEAQASDDYLNSPRHQEAVAIRDRLSGRVRSTPTAPSQSSAPPTSPIHKAARDAANGTKRRRRRKLSPGEEYALLAITENPGLSFDELKAQCGLKSAGPVYNLVRKRKVRRVEDPKPWSAHGPHVRFHPVNQSWSDISA